MRVQADRDTCVGAGMCALTAPDLFTQDEDEGLVLVLVADGTLSSDQVASAAEAARLCPSRAILTTDSDAEEGSPP
ncbi:ferredoxin [Spiractinospora alimapuensis]|uniref:ferredoxin n=1 Tax=Spiractinospora alimapuensis TaxID=2820884 RepID=UPI001F331496|nr:ferredoxin [Spiractinospora alimapuensis]QVQ51180.1 ferredoxin [Spiractinospora alimapuensis]